MSINKLILDTSKLLLSILIKPKTNSPIIYIGFGGAYFTGNLKSIHTELSKRKNILGKSIKIFWVIPNKENLNDFKKDNIPVYLAYDIKNLPLFLKTQIWFSDHGEGDIPVRKHPLSYWIQVWHGIPFKGFAGNRLTKKSFNKYDLHPVSSQWLANYYINEIGVEQNKVAVTGYPRSDDLINNIYNKKQIIQEAGFREDKKIILYAPTWAQDSNKSKSLFPWGEDNQYIKEFTQFIENNNLQCIIRTHPNWDGLTPQLKSIISQSKNLIINSLKKEPDTNKFLSVSDICITDYSSIINDFLVLDRPMIFLEPNMELFKHGFALKPEERAGIIAKNESEMYNAILRSIKEPEEYSAKRHELIKKIHYKLDGHASDRVITKVKQRLALFYQKT